jgi:hypothetical protein
MLTAKRFYTGLGLIVALGFGMLYHGFAEAQTSNGDGSFTLSTRNNGDGTVTSTLSWLTTPEAVSCTASGAAEWEGAKPGQGEVVLPPHSASEPKAYALLCQWPDDAQAFLTWTAPTQNTDGSALTNLAGFRVHYGKSVTTMTQTAQIANPAATSYTVSGLEPAQWFFGVRAYTTQGAESVMSNTTTKTTRAGAEWSQQTGIKVPAAPVMGTN